MRFVIVNSPRVTPRRLSYQYAKRLVDLLICIAALPFAIPIALLCMAAISIDAGWPVFFVQERIGRGGRPFSIYKFRTLKTNPDEKESRGFMKAYVRGEMGKLKPINGIFKPKTDSLIFVVGRILRRTSLDELPQLINIFKGEMSLVGPRPNVPWEVNEYRPWHYERLEVLPGITGMAQINGRSGISFDSIVRYDINYIENQSVAIDLKIIWQTLKSVVLSRGAG